MKLLSLPLLPFYLLRERLTRSAAERTPEPMIMDEPESVEQFHQAGATINLPVYELCALATSHLVAEQATIFDLGSGSGQSLSHLARHRPDLKMWAWQEIPLPSARRADTNLYLGMFPGAPVKNEPTRSA